MLAIFNESEFAWSNATISQYVSRMTGERTVTKNEETSVKHVDILVSNDFNVDNTLLNECVSMESCKTLFAGNTNVKFQQKDERPLVTTGTKYNTDVMFVTIKLKGRIIKDFVHNQNVHCLAKLIAADELTLIVSMKDFGNPEDTMFGIVLHDAKTKTEYTYAFAKNENNEFGLAIESIVVEHAIDRPTFRLNTYRPTRVTHLVFVEDGDYNAFSSAYDGKDKHNILVFADGSGMDLGDAIETAKNEKYKAVTLFVNKGTIVKQEYEEYTDYVNNLKENFKVVNLLLNTGRVVKR